MRAYPDLGQGAARPGKARHRAAAPPRPGDRQNTAAVALPSPPPPLLFFSCFHAQLGVQPLLVDAVLVILHPTVGALAGHALRGGLVQQALVTEEAGLEGAGRAQAGLQVGRVERLRAQRAVRLLVILKQGQDGGRVHGGAVCACFSRARACVVWCGVRARTRRGMKKNAEWRTAVLRLAHTADLPSQPPFFPVPLSPFHTMVASALSLSVAARPALATRPAAPK